MPAPTLLRCFSILHNVPVGFRVALPSGLSPEVGGGGKRGPLPRLHRCLESAALAMSVAMPNLSRQTLRTSPHAVLVPRHVAIYAFGCDQGRGSWQPVRRGLLFGLIPTLKKREPPSAAEPLAPKKPLFPSVCLCRRVMEPAEQSGLSETSRRAGALKIMPAAICRIRANKELSGHARRQQDIPITPSNP